MNTYYVEQKTELWVRTTVQADNAKDALEIGKRQIDSGEFEQSFDTWNFEDEFWIGGTDPNVAVSLNKDGSITELRIKD